MSALGAAPSATVATILLGSDFCYPGFAPSAFNSARRFAKPATTMVHSPELGNIVADELVSKFLRKAEMAPLLVEVPERYLESLAQDLARSWEAVLIIADRNPDFRAILARAVSGGMRTVLVVRDPGLVSAFIWCIQYVRPNQSVYIPIHSRNVKASAAFRICCLLKQGTADWSDEWRSHMRHWLYDSVRAEAPHREASKVNLLLQISKDSIISRDTFVFTKRVERWQSEYADQAKKVAIPVTRFLRGTVLFSLEGYSTDPRELYEIPEVKVWFRDLLRKVPYLFYFVDPNPDLHQYSLIIPMYVPFASIAAQGVQMDSNALTHFVENACDNIRTFAERIGDDPDDARAMFLDGLQQALAF